MFPILAPRDAAVPDDEAARRAIAADEAGARERFDASWLSIARRWGVEIQDLDGVFHRTTEPTLAFTTEEIVGDHELQPGWRCIGPLMTPPPQAEPPGERPLVYACFGTSYNFRTELFTAVIEGLAGQPFDVLVSTGGGRIATSELEPLPANVVVREFVAARAVLARATVHITHGGCNSVHESLLAGVPMVCVPQGFDQLPLSQRIEQLGAGSIAAEDPVAIRDGVRALLDSGSARARARELSEHLAGYDGEQRVAAVLERVLSEHAGVG
jgi:MGT family glycosyltransferase